MSFLTRLLAAAGPALRSAIATATRTSRPPGQTPKRNPGKRPGTATASPRVSAPESSPGRSGPDRTVEIDPRSVGAVRTSYTPVLDGDADPGEIIWTWVPYEENDGQGKDRPVLVVAAEAAGTVLVVQLTSKTHDGDDEFVPVGSGNWDSAHRPSWVNLERVLRVHPLGMRREASALPRAEFDRVAGRLQARYGWS